MNFSRVCRCCLSENCYVDVSKEHYFAGVKEIYSDLLFDTFSIIISYLEDEAHLICEECIVKLRAAATFKRQVEDTERTICSMYKDLCQESELHKNKSKELTNTDFEHTADHDLVWQENGIEYEENHQTIKLENDDEMNIDHSLIGKTEKSVIRNKEHRKGIFKKKLCKSKDKVEGPKKTPKKSTQSQINRKQNSLKLINNSNACLFDSLKTKFKCFYCKNSYLTIQELRSHADTHSDPKYLKMCINRLQGMSYKNVDISNLNCKLCSFKLNSLNDLQTHLIQTHKIEFTGSEHMLIPYKLEDGFKCVLCSEIFNTYYRLSVHMNTHYSNNVCEICGVSYINRLSLRVHVNSLHKEKRCSKCDLVFTSNYSRIKHMRKVHNQSEVKRYCLLCDKTFRYTYLLNEHKISEHGVERQISVCKECGKSFLSPANLRTHMRAVHLKERNHPCQYCGMSFFTSCDRRRHERTHQDVRSFSCSYCEGRFKSKDSLRRHLKRQHAQLFASEVG